MYKNELTLYKSTLLNEIIRLNDLYRFSMVRCFNTVEPPCANANQKQQNFPSQSLTVGTSSKRPLPVSDRNRDRDHFLGPTVNNFLLFLTSCKRPLDDSLICTFAVCTMLLRI